MNNEMKAAIAFITILLLVTFGFLVFHVTEDVEVVEVEVEKIVEVERNIYVDRRERQDDEFGCPVNGEFVDVEEYTKCSKIWVQRFRPDWEQDTRLLQMILDSEPRIPDCALNWYPEIACVGFGGVIEVPEKI